MKAAKIVFKVQAGFEPTLTQGTKVILPDGSELPGVTKIVLTAEPNGLWTADVQINVCLEGELGAEIEVTDMADTSRRFAPATGES